MSDLTTKCLVDLAIDNITYGVVKPGEYVLNGVKLIRGGDVSNGKIVNELRTISNSISQQYQRTILKGGELIISLVGNPGEVAIVPDSLSGANLARQVALVRLSEEVHSKFILYFFMSQQGKEQLKSRIIGSVQLVINLKDLKDVQVTFPSLTQQHSIASVLSSLDDKIDLLHRQNATLEAMAETLFRQWFVVEAKEDWEEGKLCDLVVVKYGKDHKKLLDGKIPVYGSGGIMRYADKALYNLESVLIPRKGTLSNVIYIDEPFWSVDTMFYTEMKKQNIAKFIFYFVKGLDLASMNVGSAVPSMTTEVLNNLPVDIPSDAVLEQFEQALAPLYKKMKSNQTQIRTLTVLRDTLLPKLMSGEVRVEM